MIRNRDIDEVVNFLKKERWKWMNLKIIKWQTGSSGNWRGKLIADDNLSKMLFVMKFPLMPFMNLFISVTVVRILSWYLSSPSNEGKLNLMYSVSFSIATKYWTVIFNKVSCNPSLKIVDVILTTSWLTFASTLYIRKMQFY